MNAAHVVSVKTEVKPTNVFWRKAEILVLAVKSFSSTSHLQQSTVLTYYTLFAIVPIVALLFGIAKGFALESILRAEINKRFALLPQQTLDRIYEFAERTLHQASGGIIAGIGVLVLLWTVLRLAGNIESSFNFIWHVRKGRSFFRKLSDYLSLLIVAPLLLIVLSSSMLFADRMTARISSQWHMGDWTGSPYVSVLIEHMLPLLLAVALFTFIYVFVPNTHVRFSSAIFAGFIAAVLYLAAQLVYFHAQGALFQNKIYGSLALLPLFLIWVQWSWTITLLGSEIAFVDQNFGSGQFNRSEYEISEEQKRKYAVTVAAVVVRSFENGISPVPEHMIVERTGFPLFRLRELLADLTDAGVIFKLGDNPDGEATFLPGFPTDRLSVLQTIRLLDRRGRNDDGEADFPEYKAVDSSIDDMNNCAEKSAANKLLRDLP